MHNNTNYHGWNKALTFGVGLIQLSFRIYHCVHPIHAKMFSIQMLLHFSQIVQRACTLVLFIPFCVYCILPSSLLCIAFAIISHFCFVFCPHFSCHFSFHLSTISWGSFNYYFKIITKQNKKLLTLGAHARSEGYCSCPVCVCMYVCLSIRSFLPPRASRPRNNYRYVRIHRDNETNFYNLIFAKNALFRSYGVICL